MNCTALHCTRLYCNILHCTTPSLNRPAYMLYQLLGWCRRPSKKLISAQVSRVRCPVIDEPLSALRARGSYRVSAINPPHALGSSQWVISTIAPFLLDHEPFGLQVYNNLVPDLSKLPTKSLLFPSITAYHARTFNVKLCLHKLYPLGSIL